jgi:ADP-heptose:LPS heptosyltransferase
VGLRRQTDLPVVLVGGDGDAIMAARVQALLDEPVAAAVGGMRLGEVAGLLGEAAVFVGADSGLLHVASAMGAPAVGLYGPTDPRAWAPAAPAVTVVKSPVACSPCLYQRGRPPLQIACAEPFCMHAVHPRDVVTAVLDALPRAA